jgi:RNase adaptor protein for sRNA GlmZ degradation
LNHDNEVLHDNEQDLKTAFIFLFNQHKQLIFKYKKERRNQKLIKLYRERMEVVNGERDRAI